MRVTQFVDNDAFETRCNNKFNYRDSLQTAQPPI